MAALRSASDVHTRANCEMVMAATNKTALTAGIAECIRFMDNAW